MLRFEYHVSKQSNTFKMADEGDSRCFDLSPVFGSNVKVYHLWQCKFLISELKNYRKGKCVFWSL